MQKINREFIYLQFPISLASNQLLRFARKKSYQSMPLIGSNRQLLIILRGKLSLLFLIMLYRTISCRSIRYICVIEICKKIIRTVLNVILNAFILILLKLTMVYVVFKNIKTACLISASFG